MKIFESLNSLIHQPAKKLTRIDLTPDQVVNKPGYPGPVVRNGVYVRVWVSEVYIKDAVRWATEVFPFATGTVTLSPPERGAESVQAQILTLDSRKVAQKGIFTSFPITSLMPFRGGTLQVSAELVQITGTDYYKETLDILQGFSSMALGAADSAIQVAQHLKSGINRLYKVVDGEVVLAFHETFTADDLSNGYIAIIDAPQGAYDAKKFVVKQNRLHYPDANTPFEAANHLLLRIELSKEHEDWMAIAAIKDPLDEVCSYLARDKGADADLVKPLIRDAIRTSPSLAEKDRDRVREEVKEYIKSCGNNERYSGEDEDDDKDEDTPPSPSEFGDL